MEILLVVVIVVAVAATDPGGLGDRGRGAAADRARDRLPFTGHSVAGLLTFGLGLLLAGLGVANRRRSSSMFGPAQPVRRRQPR